MISSTIYKDSSRSFFPPTDRNMHTSFVLFYSSFNGGGHSVLRLFLPCQIHIYADGREKHVLLTDPSMFWIKKRKDKLQFSYSSPRSINLPPSLSIVSSAHVRNFVRGYFRTLSLIVYRTKKKTKT